MTLSGWVRDHAGRRPAQPALVDEHTSLAWSEFDARADRWASELAHHGRGAVVVALLPQTVGAVVALVAAERAGVDLLPISAQYGEAWAVERMQALGAHALVGVEGEALRVIVVGPRSAPPSETPAVLVLTSGTSGAPKCARHTWQTLAGAVRQRDEYAGTRWLIGYPIGHFASLQVIAQVLRAGAVLVMPPDFGSKAAVRALVEQSIEYLCATPSYARQLVFAAGRDDWSRMRLRQITLGGEIADQRLLDALRAALPGVALTHIYASTELGAVVTVKDGREGFDAALLDGQRLRLEGQQLFARRGPRAMLGYVGATPLADEWVGTGDVVEVKEGRALFRGRASDVINVGGFKVNPSEVEAVIRDVPGVRDVLVVGKKSSVLGAMPQAIIVLEPGAEATLVQAEIIARCESRLPRPMVPRLFQFVERLDRSVAQKLIR
jgi:acyl-CoA synthetase (AMP-forming)/AMP-acid ligase II